MIIDYTRTLSHTMPNIKNGNKKNANVKMIDIDQYISPVISYPNPGNLKEKTSKKMKISMMKKSNFINIILCGGACALKQDM